jgi:hypothetical protein
MSTIFILIHCHKGADDLLGCAAGNPSAKPVQADWFRAAALLVAHRPRQQIIRPSAIAVKKDKRFRIVELLQLLDAR